MAGGTTWREMEERDTLERRLVVWERKHTWNKLNINTASSSCHGFVFTLFRRLDLAGLDTDSLRLVGW